MFALALCGREEDSPEVGEEMGAKILCPSMCALGATHGDVFPH